MSENERQAIRSFRARASEYVERSWIHGPFRDERGKICFEVRYPKDDSAMALARSVRAIADDVFRLTGVVIGLE